MQSNQKTVTEEDLMSMSQEDLILNESFLFTALLQSDIIYKVHSAGGSANMNRQNNGIYNKQPEISYNSIEGARTWHGMHEDCQTDQEAAAGANPWEADLFDNINIHQVSKIKKN